MAKTIFENKIGEIKDGFPVKDKCEELGVLFGCKEGRCGTCRVEILEGMDYLYPKNEKELAMDLRNNERLMCQCIIRKGAIKIKQF